MAKKPNKDQPESGEEEGEATPTPKRRALFELTLRKKTDSQPMLSIDGDGKSDIFSEAKLDDGQHLGKKTGVRLRLDCRYREKEFPFIQGDTHNFWKSHQSGEGETMFKKFLEVEVDKNITIEVLAVTRIGEESQEAEISLD